MIKNAQWIIEQSNNGLIYPFREKKIRTRTHQSKTIKIISYGMSGYGYDLRLSSEQFRVFRHLPGKLIDPKEFNAGFLYRAELHTDNTGEYFILPHNSYGLGVAYEHLIIPNNIETLFIGKSTYARCGIIVNMTPGEAGWSGYLTIEISNSSNADAKIYANEGICQALFFEGDATDLIYTGKYQNQEKVVTLAMV